MSNKLTPSYHHTSLIIRDSESPGVLKFRVYGQSLLFNDYFGEKPYDMFAMNVSSQSENRYAGFSRYMRTL